MPQRAELVVNVDVVRRFVLPFRFQQLQRLLEHVFGAHFLRVWRRRQSKESFFNNRACALNPQVLSALLQLHFVEVLVVTIAMPIPRFLVSAARACKRPIRRLRKELRFVHFGFERLLKLKLFKSFQSPNHLHVGSTRIALALQGLLRHFYLFDRVEQLLGGAGRRILVSECGLTRLL